MTDETGNPELDEMLSLVGDQMQALEEMQREQAALTAVGRAADGLVTVTLDAQRMVTDVTVDETYLDEFEHDELGAFVVAAAQQAAMEIGRASQALLAPLTRRRAEITAAASAAPLGEVPHLLSGLFPTAPDQDPPPDEDLEYPTVRR